MYEHIKKNIKAYNHNHLKAKQNNTNVWQSCNKKFGSTAKGPLSEVERLSPTQINKAFVGTQVRTLWLSGTHRRTVIKADSKVLAGLELETSLDPLGDQSYYFSSVRSTMPLTEGDKPKVIGASPGGGRLWIGPTKSSGDFWELVEAIFARATKYMDRELPVWTSADLDVDTAKVGERGSRVRWPEVYAPPPREVECTMVEADTPEEAATMLVDKLLQEKVL